MRKGMLGQRARLPIAVLYMREYNVEGPIQGCKRFNSTLIAKMIYFPHLVILFMYLCLHPTSCSDSSPLFFLCAAHYLDIFPGFALFCTIKIPLYLLYLLSALKYYTVPKEINFPWYNMKCCGENLILRGIFHVVSYFPLHFMLYRGNLDYFLHSVLRENEHQNIVHCTVHTVYEHCDNKN